ncbi:uncharacterized protein CIMG_11338 [Coccidioides immitis RS]|uniref:Uncharacterized protein n=2 Tax=Coccidioides immitis TaxID=5501 RepID=A0A0D8JV09_COCIM|nr:uncharacterized protein CIMG_11338 [Coccidioides immitis RS]KJF60994.1 hypothetical protein CIMG_11338 [Coccidioides immitis RS]KMP04698.1 hypothetical protein CIRG_04379 [Coccidioides immitis RMSCC 2394]TPX21218.1 hypothetical protein DIZ76_015173 [Coccidioides immitis]
MPQTFNENLPGYSESVPLGHAASSSSQPPASQPNAPATEGTYAGGRTRHHHRNQARQTPVSASPVDGKSFHTLIRSDIDSDDESDEELFPGRNLQQGRWQTILYFDLDIGGERLLHVGRAMYNPRKEVFVRSNPGRTRPRIPRGVFCLEDTPEYQLYRYYLGPASIYFLANGLDVDPEVIEYWSDCFGVLEDEDGCLWMDCELLHWTAVRAIKQLWHACTIYP